MTPTDRPRGTQTFHRRPPLQGGGRPLTPNMRGAHVQDVHPKSYSRAISTPRPVARVNNIVTKLPKTKDRLRVMIVGGLEEVGRNCTLMEYEDDIIIIDLGLQFPDDDMPGVDYIIPNLEYLKGKEKNIRGVLITHGHYDHIGGVPHVMPMIGNPPIYGTPLTMGIIKKRQEDFQSAPLNAHVVQMGESVQLGKFKVEFIHVNHNIPDSTGIVVHTPIGTVIHTGDWKFDHQPVGEAPADYARFAELGKTGVLALFGDSTNASHKGHQISEYDIGCTLEEIFRTAPGRMIIGTFASLLSRVQQVVQIAGYLGKKVALAGYSMKTNVDIIQELGYMKPQKDTLIPLEKIDDYPKSQVIIMCTGAQGEKNAALMRIANDEHRQVKIIPGDTVIFSSSVIPGNERTVQRLKDTLYRKGAEVIHYEMMDVHAGGHAKQEDIKLMLHLVKPKYYIPIEGNHFLLRYNEKVAKQVGIPDDHIFIANNGQVMEFGKEEAVLTDKHVPADYVFVDGLEVSGNSNVVIRDRRVLAEEGMVVVIATVETRTGKLIQNPDIISRGFVYLKDNKKLIEDLRHKVKKMVIDSDPKSWADTNHIRNKIRESVGQFLLQKTRKRPIILPVVIEV